MEEGYTPGKMGCLPTADVRSSGDEQTHCWRPLANGAQKAWDLGYIFPKGFTQGVDTDKSLPQCRNCRVLELKKFSNTEH